MDIIDKEPHQPPPAAHNEPPAARPRHRGQAGEVGVAGVTGHQATLVLCRPELCVMCSVKDPILFMKNEIDD